MLEADRLVIQCEVEYLNTVDAIRVGQRLAHSLDGLGRPGGGRSLAERGL
jgi:hypothetical protein